MAAQPSYCCCFGELTEKVEQAGQLKGLEGLDSPELPEERKELRQLSGLEQGVLQLLQMRLHRHRPEKGSLCSQCGGLETSL